MSGVVLQWITPKAEETIAYCARVSSPQANMNDSHEKLIRYLIKHRHWSPFEMASACFDITTTRDIIRQMLRHRSFSFQEFSQRYAVVDKLGKPALREARLQDETNRQSSLETDDEFLKDEWYNQQKMVIERCQIAYSWAIANGIAKEQARAVLPEGLTPSRLMMAGTIRSWLHYCSVRTTPGTQKEHREIATKISDILIMHLRFWHGAIEELERDTPS